MALSNISFAFLPGRHQEEVFDDVLPVLQALRQRGLKLGSITNGNADLGTFAPRLRAALDFEITAGDAGAGKPDPAAFLIAARCAGVSDLRTMAHVGDSFDNDVRGANALGIRAILLSRPGDVCFEPVRTTSVRSRVFACCFLGILFFEAHGSCLMVKGGWLRPGAWGPAGPGRRPKLNRVITINNWLSKQLINRESGRLENMCGVLDRCRPHKSRGVWESDRPPQLPKDQGISWFRRPFGF